MTELTGEEWEKKLLGKAIVKEDTETTLENDKIFRASQLPPGHRLLLPGSLQTRDYRPERLNVFVDKEYVVNRVYFG